MLAAAAPRRTAAARQCLPRGKRRRDGSGGRAAAGNPRCERPGRLRSAGDQLDDRSGRRGDGGAQAPTMTGADDRAAWLERNRRAMVAAFGSFVRSGGGTVLELDGVFAGINPNAAERSVFNSVVYSDREALERERERLAGAYAEHGCAWTVWVPEDDVETARMLDAAGHRLDAEPRAMGLELDGFPEPDLG